MKDRDLPVTAVLRVLRQLGCIASYEKSFITVHRPPGPRGIKQHLSKGEFDTIRRLTVRKLYRAVGITSENFYAAVDS